MKTLEKDRTRRYETANDLAADIRRHLNNEPILASPPSAVYKLRKFARRNKAAMATIGLVAGALVMGLIISTWQAVRATRAERDLAEANENEIQLRIDAEKDRDRAIVAERAAVEARKAVAEERDRAEVQRDENRRLLYTSDIATALRVWEDGVVTQMGELIERHRPKPDEEDLRGFEWYYLWRLYKRHTTVPTMQHEGVVGSIDFAPDGRSLATADVAGNVTVRDVATGRTRFQYSMSMSNPDPSVAFSPDGLKVAAKCVRISNSSARMIHSVNLWDVATGQLKETFDLNGVRHLAFSPDGYLLAVTCQDGVQIYSFTENEFCDSLVLQGSSPTRIEFSPDGNLLASTYKNGDVVLWDVESRESQVLAGPDYSATSLAFSPDGATLACGDEDGSIRLWDVTTRTQRDTIRVSNNSVIGVDFLPDGNRLVAFSPIVTLWDARVGKLLGRITVGATSIAVAPHGRTLACGQADNAVRLWRPEPDDAGTILPGHTGMVLSVAASPDGRLVASSALDNQLKLWDVITGREITTFRNVAPYVGLVFSGDGKVLAAQSATGYVHFWDVATGTRLRRIALPRALGIPRSMAFSPDEETVARGDEAGGIVLCDVPSGVLHEHFKKRAGSVVGLAFSPDGKTLAATIERKKVEVLSVATGKSICDLVDQREPSGPPAFSPDGRMLACGCFDGEVRLWDLATGELLNTLQGHVAQVTSIVFSDDGTTLFTAAYDGTVNIWDMASYQQRASLKAGADSLFSIALSRNGTVLASGGSAEVVRLWRATTEADPEKLAKRFQLETSIRDISDAEPEEQQRTINDLQSYFASAVKAGITSYDLALAGSATWDLGRHGNDNLAEALAGSDDQSLRDLGRSSLMTSSRDRAEALLKTNQLGDAIVALDRGVELRPDDLTLRLERGLVHIRMRNWTAAAADYSKAASLEPNNALIWLKTVPLLILADDREGYRRHCQEMLRLFKGKEASDSGKAIQACLFMPGVFDVSQLPLKAFEAEVKQMPVLSGFRASAAGLAAYRAGNPDNAIGWVQKAKGTPSYAKDTTVQARVLSIEAMVHHRLGDSEGARGALRQADELIAEHLMQLDSGELGNKWHDWLIAEVLRREAETLLQEPGEDTRVEM